MSQEHRDELDRILDEGLASYAGGEPLAGLEERVMNRVRTQVTGRRWWSGWRWAMAVPAVAALVITAAVWQKRPEAVKPLPVSKVSVRTPGIKQEMAPVMAAEHRAVRVQETKRELPKQERFMASIELSPAETSLMALAKAQPSEAAKLVEWQQKKSSDIVIRPLNIEPVAID